MRFLEVPEYRTAVLSGLLISIGSKTDSTVMNHPLTGGENTRTLTMCLSATPRPKKSRYVRKQTSGGC